MDYKVLKRFEDVDGEVYVVGEKYSKELDKEREDVLVTRNNAYRVPFLEKLPAQAKAKPKKKKK